MTTFEILQEIDQDLIKHDPLRNAVESLRNDYDDHPDKELFLQHAGDNISKLYQMVKKVAPDVVDEFDAPDDNVASKATKSTSKSSASKAKTKSIKAKPVQQKKTSWRSKLENAVDELVNKLKALKIPKVDKNLGKFVLQGTINSIPEILEIKADQGFVDAVLEHVDRLRFLVPQLKNDAFRRDVLQSKMILLEHIPRELVPDLEEHYSEHADDFEALKASKKKPLPKPKKEPETDPLKVLAAIEKEFKAFKQEVLTA